MTMSIEDRCWAIIAQLDEENIEARMEFLTDGTPMVRVMLDALYVVDCQIDLAAPAFQYTIYIRRYAPEGDGVIAEHAPYQASIWPMAARCIGLAHRCHEVQVRDGYEQMMHALEQSL